MASLNKVILLTEEDYTTLYNTGSVTVGDVTIVYDANNLHFTDKVSSELIDDSNSTKLFVSTAEKANIATIPNKQDALTTTSVASGDVTQIMGFDNNNTIVRSQFVPATYQTTAPTADITDGGVHIVYLTAEPSTRYSGYIYLIAE